MGSCGVGVLLLVMIGAVTPDTRRAFNRRPLQSILEVLECQCLGG